MADQLWDDRGASQRGNLDDMFAGAYAELRRVAHRRLSGEDGNHTLNTTGLVNETYIRLVRQRNDACHNRDQFFALAAMAMRRILVDYARRHRTQKRAGKHVRVSLEALDEWQHGAAEPSADAVFEQADLLIALDRALDRLIELDERAARVVDCRFFLGLNEAETADVVGVTERTVRRDWARARAWLKENLKSHALAEG